MAYLKSYTADDEEPKCENCDFCLDESICLKFCGPDNEWFGYTRTERVEDEEYF